MVEGGFWNAEMVIRRERMNCSMIRWMPQIVLEHCLGLKTPLISKLIVVVRCRWVGGGEYDGTCF